MFKVECPGCNAPYQVDERRVPAGGLKMRCPKCATSFQVDPPTDPRKTGPSPVLGAVLGAAEPGKGPPRPPRMHKATMLGVAGPAGGAFAPPRPDTPSAAAEKKAAPAPPRPGPPPAPRRAGPPPAPRRGGPPPSPLREEAKAESDAQGDSSYGELDLPTVGGTPAAAQPGKPAAAPPGPVPAAPLGGPGDAELPAPKEAPGGDLDLPALDMPPPGAPAAPAAPRPGGTKIGLGDIDLDLPELPDQSADLPAVPVGSPAATPEPGGEVDLPAVAGGAPPSAGGIDLPALGGQPAGEAELPAVIGGAEPASPADAGLPSPAGGVDLPSPVTGADLPSPAGGVDLPSSADGADLPSTAAGADLPSPFGGMGLPSPAGGVDLPSPAAGADLPSPSAGMDLPSPSGGIDLPSPSGAIDLPSPGGGMDLPPPTGAVDLPPQPAALSATVPGMPAPAEGPAAAAAGVAAAAAGAIAGEAGAAEGGGAAQGQDAFGELELPTLGDAPSAGIPAPEAQPAQAAADSLSASLGFEQPEVAAQDQAEIVRQEGGGTAYGEVSLDAGGQAEVTLDAVVPGDRRSGEDDMEFGAIPQEDEARAPAPSHGIDLALPAQTAAVAAPRAEPAEAPRKKRPTLKILAVAAIAFAIGGGALALVPSVGPYGYFLIEGVIKGGEHRALVRRTAEQTRTLMAVDTYPDAKRALGAAESARADAKRVKALAAYAAYVSYLCELRFGQESQIRARAKVLLDELKEETDVTHLGLARAAREAVSGTLARSRKSVQALARRDPKNIDVMVLRGEVELKAREAKTAVSAWKVATGLEKSARTAFGLARALYAAEDLKGAKAQSLKALKLSQGHVGARILLARIEWRSEGAEPVTIKLLGEAKKTKNASPTEVVELQTLLGDIHLERSRISHAEAAYAEALKINPKAAGALRGLGEALYRAGRYTESLARFQAGAQADPDDVSVKVGVAKLLMALERLQDAKAMLEKLRKSHPKSMEVAYWEGKAYEAVGGREKAEEAYRRAIKHGADSPRVVEAYVALAMLLNQQGQEDDARRTLDEARQKLAESPGIHKALGELALSQGRHELALKEFRTALKLDPGDVGSKFRLGVALRRDRQFEEAGKVFDEVAKVDRDYPGLALERGLLFEGSGRTEEALKAYEAALAKAPNDPDLMLRVGCGKVAAGRTEGAVDTLRKVLEQRPQSAETNHCLGRALLLEKNLAESLKKLERAVLLDPHRAQYHLYVGWVANEAGDSLKAQRALRKALGLDQGLADAYWQRGILAYRQGRVKDAVKDLQKALELRPSRHEAHADLADAYCDLGMEGQAMGEWRAAINAQPENARWRYRFGKLLAANNNHEAAQVQLSKALELVEIEKAKPRWAWEAHLLLARAMGPRREAIEHWEAFLRDGPLDSPYRAEAEAALKALGKPWLGD